MCLEAWRVLCHDSCLGRSMLHPKQRGRRAVMVGYEGMGWDGIGWDVIRRDGMWCDGMGCGVMGWDVVWCDVM